GALAFQPSESSALFFSAMEWIDSRKDVEVLTPRITKSYWLRTYAAISTPPLQRRAGNLLQLTMAPICEALACGNYSYESGHELANLFSNPVSATWEDA